MQPTNKSRKFSILAAILILLVGIAVGGYLVLKSGRGSAGQLADILSSASKSLADCQGDPSDTNKDSDSDGLKDWQEMQIYKSDACKPDTDGDGYLDGEEVASGYDPTKKAPGDELAGARWFERARRPLSAPTVGRHEEARRVGPDADPGSENPADGRTIFSARHSNPAVDGKRTARAVVR